MIIISNSFLLTTTNCSTFNHYQKEDNDNKEKIDEKLIKDAKYYEQLLVVTKKNIKQLESEINLLSAPVNIKYMCKKDKICDQWQTLKDLMTVELLQYQIIANDSEYHIILLKNKINNKEINLLLRNILTTKINNYLQKIKLLKKYHQHYNNQTILENEKLLNQTKLLLQKYLN